MAVHTNYGPPCLFPAAQEVFSMLNHRKHSSLNLSPYVSYFEIYNSKVGTQADLPLAARRL